MLIVRSVEKNTKVKGVKDEREIMTMKVLSKEILIHLLETEYKDKKNIWPNDFKYMFLKYGDEYYLENGTQYVKTVENPEAKEILMRKKSEDLKYLMQLKEMLKRKESEDLKYLMQFKEILKRKEG